MVLRKAYIFPVLGLFSLVPLAFISNLIESKKTIIEYRLSSEKITVKEDKGEQEKLDKSTERKGLEQCPDELKKSIPARFKGQKVIVVGEGWWSLCLFN